MNAGAKLVSKTSKAHAPPPLIPPPPRYKVILITQLASNHCRRFTSRKLPLIRVHYSVPPASSHLKRSRSFGLLQNSRTLLFDFALDIVCRQFLSTVANFLPSAGSYVRDAPNATTREETAACHFSKTSP